MASRVRESFIRAVVYLITRILYRIRVVGVENLPQSGPALLICNHTSFADGNLILSVCRRAVRFVVYKGYSQTGFLRWLSEGINAIPVDSEAAPKQIVQALRQASDALNRGELVCIFAEGSISRTGFLLPFHRGMEMILKKAPNVPIIPMYIDGMWGSIFSFQRGKFFWKWPKKLPYPVTIKFGRAMPSASSVQAVREQVLLLGVDCFELRKTRRLPLHRTFLRTAKRYARRPCVADAETPMMNFGTTLLRSVVLWRLLKRRIGPEQRVGVYLPPAVGSAIVNIVLAYLRRVAVNLNYTVGQETLDQCIRQAGIKQVLTSKRFLERIKERGGPIPNAELILLEDLRPTVTTADKLVGALARVMPAWFTDRFILRTSSHTVDDLATIIFSSGSTGEPKGVMLTHHNVASDIDSVVQQVDATEQDSLMGVLPIFHSFGYTVTCWLPLIIGAATVYHTNPLEAEIIGKLVREYTLSIMVSTATFLRGYIRKCDDNDFKTLRLLVCGAEKLPMQVADQFEKKFGVRPLEGYGCTELSPAVSANRPDVVHGSYRQIGNKLGTIGHPMPGQAVRIVEPETWTPLPLGKEGMLIVKGANVMLGYLDKPELTASVIRDGWYATGDIAKLDEDGFITITDRVSRFSKIAGEMVPHGKVEDAIQCILDNSSDQMVIVTGIPDLRKGERLAVIHTPLPISVDQLWEEMKNRLPPIWLPARRAFIEVPELPVLGTGKVDLKRAKKIAEEKLGEDR